MTDDDGKRQISWLIFCPNWFDLFKPFEIWSSLTFFHVRGGTHFLFLQNFKDRQLEHCDRFSTHATIKVPEDAMWLLEGRDAI